MLDTPGENALKVKDATGRLPIHILAERGVSIDMLLLLIALYPDGCYRTNKIYSREKKSTSIQSSAELLLRQIMKNLSICESMGNISRMLLDSIKDLSFKWTDY